MGTQIIGGHIFDYVCDVEPQRDRNGEIFLDRPQPRYENEKRLPLHRYGAGVFCRFEIPSNLHCEGVYVLIATDEVRQFLYVGECEDLSRRFNQGYGTIHPRNCFIDGQSTNCRINRCIWQAASLSQKVELWFLATADRKRIETGLIAQLEPPWNIQKGG